MGSDGLGSFGATLRQVRSDMGLSLRDLAQRCGSDYTHLSRVENGRDRAPSRHLLERILSAIDDPAAAAVLAGAAGQLTPVTERAVSAFPRALAEPLLSTRALPALRRIDAGGVAENLLSRLPGRGIVGDRVDAEALCRIVGLRPRTASGDQGAAATFDGDDVVVQDPGHPGDPATLPRVRFLLAHAAAHVALGQRRCSFPRTGGAELPALDVAAHLLCPRQLLARALQDAIPALDEDARNPWAPRSAEVAAAVAERLAVPGWVALRRLADEGLLDDDALTSPWETTSD